MPVRAYCTCQFATSGFTHEVYLKCTAKFSVPFKYTSSILLGVPISGGNKYTTSILLVAL